MSGWRLSFLYHLLLLCGSGVLIAEDGDKKKINEDISYHRIVSLPQFPFYPVTCLADFCILYQLDSYIATALCLVCICIASIEGFSFVSCATEYFVVCHGGVDLLHQRV